MNLTEPRELAPLLEPFCWPRESRNPLSAFFELFEEGERPEPAVFKKP